MMTQFWFLGALLVLLALAFVLVPVWLRHGGENAGVAAPQQSDLNLSLYRERLLALEAEYAAGDLDAEAYAALKLETERALLAEADASTPVRRYARGRWLPLVGALILVPASLGLYQLWGAAPQLALSERLQQAPQSREEMLAWLDAVEQGLGDQPAPEQLYNLARSYQSLRELDQAERIYRRLLAQAGPQAELFAQLAQLRFIKSGNPLDAELGRHLQRALQLDSDNLTALGLAGIRAYEGGDYRAAIDYWGRALELEPEGEGAQALRTGIARAEEALGDGRAGPPVTSGLPVEAPQRQIALQVQLPEKGAIAPNARVFVFARASNGAPMPLAVVAFSAAELPKQLVLDSSMAMTEGMSLDQFDQVDLIARVSLSGDVKDADFEARHSGFRFGDLQPVKLQLQPLALAP